MTIDQDLGQSKNEVLSPMLSRVVDSIAGKEADMATKEWVAGNIASIREATRDGRHNTVYYPASGGDIIRPLYAYNATHLVIIDNDGKRVGETERQLQELGIPAKVQISPDGKKREITFEMEGKERKVTEINGDARLVKLNDLGVDQVDVLHIYLPTGAETIDEEGHYVWGIYPQLSVRNYEMVNEGGFFCFQENRPRQFDLTPSLIEIMGLEEVEISGRDLLNKTNYIYKKTKTVDSHVIGVYFETSQDVVMSCQRFTAFEAGGWRELRGTEEEVGGIIGGEYAKIKDSVAIMGKKFAEAGVELSLVERLIPEALKNFRDRVLALQQQLGEMLKAYEEMREGYDSGKMDDRQAMEYMGIVVNTDKDGGVVSVRNGKWPLAVEIATSDEGEQVQEVATRFAETDFSDIFKDPD